MPPLSLAKQMLENVAFIGDELKDVKLLKVCGLPFAVGDADHRAKDVADIVCEHIGGHGAFREAVERLLILKGINIDKIVEESL